MKRLLFVLALCLGLGALPAFGQVKKAERALKKAKYDEALEHVEEALAKAGDDAGDRAEALEVKGRIYLAQAQAAEDARMHADLIGMTVEAFHAAAEADEEVAADVRNQLTLAYVQGFQRAIEAYNAAQQADSDPGFVEAAMYFGAISIIAPDSTGPYVNKAFSLINAGQEADAIDPLLMAVERGERDEDIYTYLSNLLLTNDRAAEAVDVLEEASDDMPGNEVIQNQLLNAYALSGQIDRAVEKYGSIVEASPDNKVYRYNYGSLLLQAEQYEAATSQLHKAVELDADYADAQYNLGAAYVNWAVDVNQQINAIDDELRADDNGLTEEEQEAKEEEMLALTDRRRELFGEAVSPLEKARVLVEASGGDVTDICKVLFQSYAQTGETEKAETVQACAGY